MRYFIVILSIFFYIQANADIDICRPLWWAKDRKTHQEIDEFLSVVLQPQSNGLTHLVCNKNGDSPLSIGAYELNMSRSVLLHGLPILYELLAIYGFDYLFIDLIDGFGNYMNHCTGVRHRCIEDYIKRSIFI